jgi:hypothetical protein
MRSSVLRIERRLRSSFEGILAAACGVAVVGCGSTQPACGGCMCNQEAAAPQSYDVTYVVCATDDAGADSGDAGDAGGDAGVCFASCTLACETLKPSSISGFGSCVSAPDAGAGSTVTASCETLMQACAGRKLDGLHAPDLGSTGNLKTALAEMAWLEAASVRAFHRLARELRAHGAPAHLVKRARACARDEARHARMMTRLARAHAAVVPRVVVRPLRSVRSLEDVARENVVEGCVGETFGALLAMWQAERTTNLGLARALRAIAPDEVRHAALAWAVSAWAETKLDDAARARVRSARDAKAAELVESTKETPAGDLARALVAQVLRAA